MSAAGLAHGPDPTPLLRLITGYWESQALLTANRLGLFAALADGPRTAAEVSEAIGTRPRPTRLLLNACAALGLLEADAGAYGNAPVAAAFLVPGRPGYLGNGVRYSDNLWATWGLLEAALRDDEPQLPEETYLGRDPAQTRAFVYGMHDRALGDGRALVGLIDLTGRRKMLDVGGGPGTYSSLFTGRYAGLRSVLLDLPDVVEIAKEIVADMGAADHVATLAGSYHDTPFPGGNDVVLISGVLHREDEAGARSLIARAVEALEPGGVLVVSDVMTDAGGAAPAFATLFGLNMLLTAPRGGVHADADVEAWMREAGLADTERRPFPPPMPHRVVTGLCR